MTSTNELRQSVLQAAERPEVRDAVHSVYVALQDGIELRKPVCVSSGRCCRFEEFGHRLYVTTMELATFVRDLKTSSGAINVKDAMEKWDGQGCPFQFNKLCGVHAIRPFGCRVFFCDSTSTHWQTEQYERFHKELKRLHEQLAVTYFYVEWRDALRSCFSLNVES